MSKQDLIDELCQQIQNDAIQGDTTVLDEILQNVPVNVLVNSLPEEEMNKFDGLVQADKQEQIINKAFDYLCETDEDDEDHLSIPDQVRAIQNHKGEKSDMIDHIDGVYVVERFEYSFTVESFLDQIRVD